VISINYLNHATIPRRDDYDDLDGKRERKRAATEGRESLDRP
jgi:hypothetical protein